MNIQKATFPCGGFALHKIPTPNGGVASAWYDAAGRLLDVGARDKTGRPCGTVTGGPAWNECAKQGRIYRA